MANTNISIVAPVLSYVASSDISAVTHGYVRYSIHFEKDLVTYGNVIMFEYMIKSNDTVIPTNINTNYGFVSVNSAIQTGICNDYILPIPVETNTLNNQSQDNISVRVYSGLTGINDVFVTNWSNSLQVYCPPLSVNLNGAVAYYDKTTYATNSLYVVFDETKNKFDYDVMHFIVCYFYQDENNNTVWNVSDPLYADTNIGNNYRYVEVPKTGLVSTNHPIMYLSMHAMYNWTHDTKLYYAISNASIELVANPATIDNKPDITNVVYNVYNDDPISVPGTQTITVTYIPPGHSVVPIYNVTQYDLYYSIDNGIFTKYNAQPISPTTLSYTVNVGSNTTLGTPALNMSCGQNIKFRVDCTTVIGVVESSDESSPTNIFKYSEAVTGLSIANIRNDAGKTSFIVIFNGVKDLSTPNKGCGAGLFYNIKINDQTYSPSGGDTVTYVSGKTYAVNYSNIPDATGNVSVCLTTENTNGNTPINGMVVSVPYASYDFILDPIIYNVYANGNANQNMNLSWAAPIIPAWTVTNYAVQISTNDGTSWNNLATTSNTSYTYDASVKLSNTSVKLSFRVIVSIKKDTTSYAIPSNTQQMNTFTYGSSVSKLDINWVTANTTETSMDINISFCNPKNSASVPITNTNDGLGTNNGVSYFKVNVLDSTSTVIAYQDIPYDVTATLYTVSFNNVPYVKTGNIAISTYVKNQNNSDDLITYDDYINIAAYNASTVPEFDNLVATGSSVSGNIFSQTPLCIYGNVITSNPTGSSKLTKTPIQTNNTTAGFEITYTIDTDDTYIYTFKLVYNTFFGEDYPPTFGINVSNTAGVGSLLVLDVNPPI